MHWPAREASGTSHQRRAVGADAGHDERQCPDCRYWFAAPVNRALEPRCLDCVEKLSRGRRRAAADGGSR